MPRAKKMLFKTSLRDGNCLFNSIESFLHYEQTQEKLPDDLQKLQAQKLRNLTCISLQNLYQHDDLIKILIQQEIQESHGFLKTPDDYFKQMNNNAEWGGNIEIIAIAKLLNRSIEVYKQVKRKYKNKYHIIGGFSIDNTQQTPIKLLYRGQHHYDYIIS